MSELHYHAFMELADKEHLQELIQANQGSLHSQQGRDLDMLQAQQAAVQILQLQDDTQHSRGPVAHSIMPQQQHAVLDEDTVDSVTVTASNWVQHPSPHHHHHNSSSHHSSGILFAAHHSQASGSAARRRNSPDAGSSPSSSKHLGSFQIQSWDARPAAAATATATVAEKPSPRPKTAGHISANPSKLQTNSGQGQDASAAHDSSKPDAVGPADQAQQQREWLEFQRHAPGLVRSNSSPTPGLAPRQAQHQHQLLAPSATAAAAEATKGPQGPTAPGRHQQAAARMSWDASSNNNSSNRRSHDMARRMSFDSSTQQGRSGWGGGAADGYIRNSPKGLDQAVQPTWQDLACAEQAVQPARRDLAPAGPDQPLDRYALLKAQRSELSPSCPLPFIDPLGRAGSPSPAVGGPAAATAVAAAESVPSSKSALLLPLDATLSRSRSGLLMSPDAAAAAALAADSIRQAMAAVDEEVQQLMRLQHLHSERRRLQANARAAVAAAAEALAASNAAAGLSSPKGMTSGSIGVAAGWDGGSSSGGSGSGMQQLMSAVAALGRLNSVGSISSSHGGSSGNNAAHNSGSSGYSNSSAIPEVPNSMGYWGPAAQQGLPAAQLQQQQQYAGGAQRFTGSAQQYPSSAQQYSSSAQQPRYFEPGTGTAPWANAASPADLQRSGSLSPRARWTDKAAANFPAALLQRSASPGPSLSPRAQPSAAKAALQGGSLSPEERWAALQQQQQQQQRSASPSLSPRALWAEGGASNRGGPQGASWTPAEARLMEAALQRSASPSPSPRAQWNDSAAVRAATVHGMLRAARQAGFPGGAEPVADELRPNSYDLGSTHAMQQQQQYQQHRHHQQHHQGLSSHQGYAGQQHGSAPLGVGSGREAQQQQVDEHFVPQGLQVLASDAAQLAQLQQMLRNLPMD